MGFSKEIIYTIRRADSTNSTLQEARMALMRLSQLIHLSRGYNVIEPIYFAFTSLIASQCREKSNKKNLHIER